MTEYRYLKGSETSVESVEFDTTKTEDGLPTTCVVNVDLLLCGINAAPCGNGEDYRLTVKECRDLLKFVEQNREQIKKTEPVKTLHGWRESGFRTFEDYFDPGDEVSDGVVDYFTNILPPAAMDFGYLQMGEAFSHEYDPEKEKSRATFLTFCEGDDKKWKFIGYCFYRESRNRIERKGRLAQKIAELEKIIERNRKDGENENQ